MENITGSDKLSQIFNRQKELMDKYRHIYAETGFTELVSEKPVALDLAWGQHIFKYSISCMYEELGEALHAMRYKSRSLYIEEFIDALHFLTEASINIGFIPCQFWEDHPSGKDRLDHMFICAQNHIASKPERGMLKYLMMELWTEMAMCCNMLNAKPWKKNPKPFDRKHFEVQLERVWLAFIAILSFEELNADTTLELYLGKSEVNKQRQQSDY